MLTAAYLTTAVTGVILYLFFHIIPRNRNGNPSSAIKVAALILAAIFIIRYLYAPEAIRNTQGLNISSPIDNPFLTALAIFLLWFTYASVLMLILYPFFPFKFLRNALCFFAMPVFILNFIFLFLNIQAIIGTDACSVFDFRLLLIIVEFAMSMSLCATVTEKCKLKIGKRAVGVMIAFIAGALIASIPGYVPQALIGFGNYSLNLKAFTVEHRIALYVSLLIPIIIYIILKKRDFEIKRFLLLYISLAMLLTFCVNYKFDTITTVTSWPLHLCHTAMFIVPLCLIFKLDKIYYFTFFINVLGAFLAMAIPSTGDANITSSRVVLFWINHYSAFFMPILLVALRIYERPKLRQYIYSITAFAVYYLFILVVNAWFSNYGEVDFFFVNSDFITSKLGDWAEALRKVTFEFKINNLTFKFYPIYQLLFFITYVALAMCMWFLYEQFFAIADLHADMHLRKKKIKLDKLALEAMLNGRSIEEPMDTENTDKLIINNLSKTYRGNKIKAVDGVSLEIYGGEIFGFLGPNGAGKSTIIKSIVGIQPYSEGSITVCGYDVEKQSVQAKRQIGFVPDHYALYENLTGREYINYIADLYEVSEEDRNERIERYVTLFNLKNSFDNAMKTYSHGMKQKIAIMAALVHDPKLWILDEPLTGLDPESIFQVKKCMQQHAENGNIVFFSSHIIDVVERICDRIAIIKGGHILCCRTVNEIEKNGVTLEKFYLTQIGELNDEIS